MTDGFVETTSAIDLASDVPEVVLLRQLGLLALCGRGLPSFYQALLRETDETLRVAALAALLELGAVWPEQVDLVLAYAHWGAIKKWAFPFFLSVFEYGLAEKVAESTPEDADVIGTERMRAELVLSYGEMAELDRRLFLAHGTPDYLWSAEVNAERHGGWKAALPAATRSVLARPVDPNGPLTILNLLLQANQTELLQRVCESFKASRVFPDETAIFEAAILNGTGHYKEALKKLQGVSVATSNVRLKSLNFRLRAEAFEGLGDFGQAYLAHQRHNTLGRSDEVDPKEFYRGVRTRSAYQIDPGTEMRTEANVMMLGFPRSGTTLLENALAVHPKIETFEETAAFSRMARALQRFVPNSPSVTAAVAQDARNRYYDELSRNSKKPQAEMRLDKMPLYTADAIFLKNMFPDQRYIFSIRHPYDVVMSCFRQSFTANPAMENLHTLADASALYDFTMSKWFDVHSLTNDPSVVYVRYEDLVENFKPTIERVLSFLQVGWDDAIYGFVEAASRRPTKTPSYKKVRSGLSIGVQTSRENYAFLFDTKETSVLKRWVKHFGYSS
jgi:hypothetical protein